MGWPEEERSRDMAHNFLIETPILSLKISLSKLLYKMKINATPNCEISALITKYSNLIMDSNGRDLIDDLQGLLINDPNFGEQDSTIKEDVDKSVDTREGCNCLNTGPERDDGLYECLDCGELVPF